MIPDAPRWTWGRNRNPRRIPAWVHPRRATVPVVESLEARQLLSFFTGPSANRPVLATAGAFLVQVNGPGVVNVHPSGKGGIDLTAYGTTADTTLNITQTRPRLHFPGQLQDGSDFFRTEMFQIQ